ncbi:hypothetical protein [Hirschia litorea]|uniref:3-hydroxylacyl-ACP dehydratase n=1 Tax=Hirschia litorea TaxID=1199156 RepID=A0ABW2INV9_9PROT
MSIISQVLPHAGDMVLIDEIVSLSADKIECRTQSHRLKNNPLSMAKGLPITAGLEYGAQAVALHGLLNSTPTETHKQSPKLDARIIAVKSASWTHDWLDQLDQPLTICATRLTHLDTLAQYHVELTTSTHQTPHYQAHVTVLLSSQT